MKLFKSVLINIVVFIMLIITVDFALGLINDKNLNVPISSRYIQLREYPPKIDADIDVIIENKAFNSSIKTDENGFIMGPNSDLEYSDIDIAFLGGSTTECYYIKPEYRFPYLVQEILKSSTSKNVRTVNAGVSGSSSVNSNMVLLSKIIDLKPKYVFLMHNVNDLVLLSKTKSYWDAPDGRAIILDRNKNKTNSNPNYFYSFAQGVKNIFFPNTYRIFKKFLFLDDNFFANNLNLNEDEFSGFRGNFFLEKPNDLKEIKSQFINSLQTFINVSRANNIEPVLMTQPNRIENKSDYFEYEFKKVGYNKKQLDLFSLAYSDFNSLIDSLAILNQVKLIDLNKLIPKEEEYIYDSVHLSNNGSKLVAEIISNYLINNLKFE